MLIRIECGSFFLFDLYQESVLNGWKEGRHIGDRHDTHIDDLNDHYHKEVVDSSIESRN